MGAPDVRLIRHADVAVVEIDHKPVNALSKAVRRDLLGILVALDDDPSVSAVVVHGAEGRFIAGADLTELAGPLEEPYLPDVISSIERLSKPVIAAIDGAALGGGLEIALACDRRIASPRSAFGLPETRLGLVPGAGGTQRLPRLTGLDWAEAIVATGTTVPAPQALYIGLIDDIADDPLHKAIANARSTPKRRLSATSVVGRRAESCGRHPTFILRQEDPAVQAAIALVRGASTLSFEEGLRCERQTFLRLRGSRRAQALIHLFLAGRMAFRQIGPAGSPSRRLEVVAVMGSGQRSALIAERLRRSGLKVDLGSGRIHEADLVVDTTDKFKVEISIQLLAAAAKPGAVIASARGRNIDRLAAASGRGGDVVGLHFRLSDRCALVEVAPALDTAPETTNAVLALVRKTGIQAVVTREPGLAGERLIAAGRAGADQLRASGVRDDVVNAVLRAYGLSRPGRSAAAADGPAMHAIRRRLLEDIAAEGTRLLSEGIVSRPGDIDLILTHGYGFPPEEGGPMWAAGIRA